jgi:hypothetical protein
MYISPSQATADAGRYDFVWGSHEPGAWKAGNSELVTSWYMPFDGDGTTRHSLGWWKAYHPDWILYRCDQRTPAWPDGLQNIPLDISDPDVVRWQMQTYGPAAQAAGFDAMALDLVELNNANGGCGVFVNGVWHQRFNGQHVDRAWTRAVLHWMHYAFPYLHGFARPMLVAVNHVPESRAFGDADETDLLAHIDIVNDESAFTVYGNQYVSSEKFARIIRWMKYTQGLGKPFIVDDKWNTPGLTFGQLSWALSTYLMGKYHYSSVFIDHLPGYGYEYWHPEYTAPVGTPCADTYADQHDSGVYYRRYTGAFIVLNASSSRTYSLPLPKPSYTSLEGQIVTSPLTAGPDSGHVLLTSSGCH